MGVNHMMDFRQVDYTRYGMQYDLILDVIARKSPSDYRRALKPGSVFVMIGGSMRTIFFTLIAGHLFPGKRNQKLKLLPHKPNKENP